MQLSYFSDLLAKLPTDYFQEYKVDLSEFQISIYYGELVAGKSDFSIPSDFLVELSRLKIRVNVAVIP